MAQLVEVAVTDDFSPRASSDDRAFILIEGRHVLDVAALHLLYFPPMPVPTHPQSALAFPAPTVGAKAVTRPAHANQNFVDRGF